MAHIRNYKPSDSDAAAHICRETLLSSLASYPSAYRLAPYVWTHPYTYLSPSTCWVLDDGTGRAVGYCIGCPDIFDLVRRYDQYVQQVLDPSDEIEPPRDLSEKEPWFLTAAGEAAPEDIPADQLQFNEQVLLQLAYDPRRALVEGKDVLWRTHKGTMHIDLLEEFQGIGWGKQLIQRFVQSLKDEVGAQARSFDRGIHIGIGQDNGKVVAFYEKCGFRLQPGGEAEGTIWMIRDVE